MKKNLGPINHNEDMKIKIGRQMINSWIINFQGNSEDGNRFGFVFRVNVYSISMGIRQICMLNTTVCVIDETGDHYWYEDKFVDINSRKKINYGALSVKGDFCSIEGDYDCLKIWALIPWATIDFTLRSNHSILYDNHDGETRLNGETFYGFSAPEWDTEGTIDLDGKMFNVRGKSWLERRYTNIPKRGSQKEDNLIRLNLSFSNRPEKISIWSVIHRPTGEEESWADVLLPDGRTEKYLMSPLSEKVAEYWVSGETGQKYPKIIRILIPEMDIDLATHTAVDMQEATSRKQVDCRYFGTGYFNGRVKGEEESGNCSYEITGLWK